MTTLSRFFSNNSIRILSKYGDKPAHRPWAELPGYLRDSNRDQADHMAVKLTILSDLGITAKALVTCGESALGVESKDEQHEVLARFWEQHSIELEDFAAMEHRRWCASTILAGFTHNETRNERKRHHHDLIEYSRLPEGTKQWDRDVIFQLPITVAQMNSVSALF